MTGSPVVRSFGIDNFENWKLEIENIFCIVCKLKENENHLSTSFKKLWVVGWWWCTEIIASALLLLFLNLSTLSVEFRDVSKEKQEPSSTIFGRIKMLLDVTILEIDKFERQS